MKYPIWLLDIFFRSENLPEKCNIKNVNIEAKSCLQKAISIADGRTVEIIRINMEEKDVEIRAIISAAKYLFKI